MSSSSRLLLLVEIMGVLRERYGASVGYQTLRRMAVEGRIPAGRTNGRWRLAEKHVPLVAEALGLAAPAVGEAAPVVALA
jgi:hypothetical protein